MKRVDHFELASEIFLREVIEHTCVYETLHECAPVLWETQTGQPFVTDPLVVHLTKHETLEGAHNINPAPHILYTLKDVIRYCGRIK